MSLGKAAIPVGVFVCLAAAVLRGQEIEFNRDIRPILSDQCFACHGPDAGQAQDQIAASIRKPAPSIDLGRATSPSCPAIAAKSELIRRVTSADTGSRMPPAYAGAAKLTDRRDRPH